MPVNIQDRNVTTTTDLLSQATQLDRYVVEHFRYINKE